ncbi:MAG: hypothetical protein ABFS21_11720, partial [Actinomycetota bacterium]
GWYQSYPEIPGDGDWDIVLTSGLIDSGNDFGNYTTGTKSGHKFFDGNQDGLWNEGDERLAGWLIGIYQDGVLIAEGFTSDGTLHPLGYYEFSGLMPGDYVVCEVLKFNWVQTAPNATTDPSASCTGLPLPAGAGLGDTLAIYGHAITIESADNHTNNDFGNYLPPDEGCTPGFWQGGTGEPLWDGVADPLAADVTLALSTQVVYPLPVADVFYTDAEYNDIFGGTDTRTLLEIVGTGGGSDFENKAKRDMIAALLNSVDDEVNYPYSVNQIVHDFFVIGDYEAFHTKYGAANELGCPR